MNNETETGTGTETGSEKKAGENRRPEDVKQEAAKKLYAFELQTEPPQAGKPRSIWCLFADCFQLLLENLTLFWPFLLLLLIVQVFAAVLQQTEAELLNPILLAILLVFWALLMGFSAGIYHMAYQAVWRKFNPNPEKPPGPFENLMLLREFLPGVGAYFVPFFIGGLVHVLFLLALKFGADALIASWGGYPAPILKLQEQIIAQNAIPAPEQMQRVVESMTPEQMQVMYAASGLMLGVLLLYTAFSFLTMLWPAMTIAYDASAPTAYKKSASRFFKSPLIMLAIVLAYVLVSLLIVSIFSGIGGFVGGLQGLFLLMGNLWFVLLTCYLVASVRKSEEASANGVDASGRAGDSSGAKGENSSKISYDA